MKNEIIIGDCAEVLKQLPDESIDCIVTDPPYGYSFMGLSWDKALPSEEALRECCRVLKAGAFGFFMCAPRQDVLSRMIIRLEDAGFNIGFSSLYHCYASGFPKSSNIGKLIDKRNGRLPEEYKALGNYLKTQREVKKLSQKDIAVYFPSKTGGLTGCYWNWENAANVPTLEQWGILKELLDLDSRFDELIEREEAEREIIGTRFNGVGSDSGTGRYQMNNGNSKLTKEVKITAQTTDKAREFSGAFAGNSLKPAVEIVIVVMKPLDCKTYVDQALKNGKGVSWLDSCRIPYGSDSEKWTVKPEYRTKKTWRDMEGRTDILNPETDFKCNEGGRFPANLLCSDNCLDRGIITKCSKVNSPLVDMRGGNYGAGLGRKLEDRNYERGYNDSGDFSRYFSLDAWFDKKLSELPEEQQKTFPFLITPKPSKREKNKYIENKHPTVKPLKLMSYLITMGSREGDVILDPFAGSGTTLEACKLLNRVFIGIDKDPENEKYMRARGQLDKTTLESFQASTQEAQQ